MKRRVICAGPGPHAPADGYLGDTDQDDEGDKALCPRCGAGPAPLPAPVPTVADRLAALEEEVRGIRARTAQTSVLAGTDAAKLRDAVAGPQTTTQDGQV